jgi:hypothetical protein
MPRPVAFGGARAAGGGNQAIIFRAELLTQMAPALGLLLPVQNGSDHYGGNDQNRRDDQKNGIGTHRGISIRSFPPAARALTA